MRAHHLRDHVTSRIRISVSDPFDSDIWCMVWFDPMTTNIQCRNWWHSHINQTRRQFIENPSESLVFIRSKVPIQISCDLLWLSLCRCEYQSFCFDFCAQKCSDCPQDLVMICFGVSTDSGIGLDWNLMSFDPLNARSATNDSDILLNWRRIKRHATNDFKMFKNLTQIMRPHHLTDHGGPTFVFLRRYDDTLRLRLCALNSLNIFVLILDLVIIARTRIRYIGWSV